MLKRYDEAYFQRWYPRTAGRLTTPAMLARKVALAVGVAEYHLGRPVARVLDIGCGEGAWRAPLRRIRPRVQYLGLDSSEYVVERYGRSRNIRPLSFGQLGELRFDRPFDLLVCSDVIHYLPTAELRRGLSGFAELGCGVAFLETWCRGDAIEGDREGFYARTAAWYRTAFRNAGLTPCGSHCYLLPALAGDATALERCDP
ncbi:MAG: class I SAM-dependent methyltransferase [Xanthomonadaceae bacterium]|nr:class I SAM-dependent methyltransferase [Xanthomonadaceae bacterium]